MVSHNANLAACHISGRTIKPMLPAPLLRMRHTIPACIKMSTLAFLTNTNANGYNAFPRGTYSAGNTVTAALNNYNR